jgi:hypothetical protein
MERKKAINGVTSDMLGQLPIFKELIILLGFCAIAINLLMNIFYFLLLLRGKHKNIPGWLPLINFLFLVVQVLYFSLLI